MIQNLHVNNFGSLINFTNDESPFTSKNAVIHGLNGSGKSQICSILRQTANLKNAKSDPPNIRTDTETKILKYISSRLSKEASTKNVDVSIDSYRVTFNTEKLSYSETGIAPDIYVFNDDYVQDNVGDLVNIKDKEIRIGQKNEIRDNLILEKNEQEKALRKIDEQIDRLILTNREATTYGNQARTEKIISRDNYLAESNTGEKDDTAREQRDRLANPPDPITSHHKFTFPALSIDDETRNTLISIFNNAFYEPKLTQDIYKKYINLKKNFYEDGISLFKEEKNICPFCLSPKTIDDPTINELIRYLNSDYASSKSFLHELSKTLKTKVIQIQNFIDNWNTQITFINEKAGLISLGDRLTNLKFDEASVKNLISLIENKFTDMTSIVDTQATDIWGEYDSSLSSIENAYEKHISIINSINQAIDQISTIKRGLGDRIIKNQLYLMWENSSLRERHKELLDKIDELKTKISEASLVISNSSIPDFFNQIIRILSIHKYELNKDSFLLLKLTRDFNISKEGYRISTGERKFIAFSYFLAEVLASAGSSSDLKQKTIVIDDPVDSSDYDKFYSFISVIENFDNILRAIYKNKDIDFGQILIFTHNSLLYERFINSDKLTQYLLQMEDNKTNIFKPQKKISLATFSSYIRKVTNFIKRMNDANTKDIGNYLRRILEIICSVENIDTNAITNLNASSHLNALANHLSHESIERILDPLPFSHEYLAASIELIEEIKTRMPYMYNSIVEKYLDNKGIEIYRDEYTRKYLAG